MYSCCTFYYYRESERIGARRTNGRESESERATAHANRIEKEQTGEIEIENGPKRGTVRRERDRIEKLKNELERKRPNGRDTNRK